MRVGLLALFGLILAAGCTVQQSAAPVEHSQPAVDSDGKTHQPLSIAPGRLAVLIFVLQDCPICNSYAPELQRIAAEVRDRGVNFYLVKADPDLSGSEARRHAKEYGYTFPVLMDREHKLVNRFRIKAVPTVLLLGPGAAIRYEGRIDDRYADLGKPREAATTHELRDALAALLDGRPVAVAQTPVVGCAVPDLTDK